MQPFEVLEREWAEFNDLDPAGMVACSSGTAAIHLSLEALRLPLGSEVVCPDMTMVACPRAIAAAGLTPVFVDCGDDLLMDPKLIKDKLVIDAEQYVSAVLVVHVYGRRWDTGRVVRWGLVERIVEDLAEAHGVRPHPSTDAAAWSFYRNKVVAGEEGGAVWFRNPEHAELARSLRSLGFTSAHDFCHVPRGWNHRMSNAHARIILDPTTNRWGCLQEIEGNTERRRELERWMDRLCPIDCRMPPRDTPWVYDIRLPGLTVEGQDRLVRELQAAGIAARHAFKPMSQQEEFKCCRLVRGEEHRAAQLAREVIYLPLAPGSMDGGRVEAAFGIVRETLESLSVS